MKLGQSNNRISLPKPGWIQYRNSRQVVGEVKNVTVSQSCGKWYVSMSKSAVGTVSQPGRNVRVKSGLNRLILDQGWYELRRPLKQEPTEVSQASV